jgi:ParB family chromosome partitioning protein
MTTRRRGGLGSGLDALLPAASPETRGNIREIPIERVRANKHQPRSHFDPAALDELASSIREHGVIQPLVVSEQSDGTFELIAGERRWRASKQAGLSTVPIIVREAAPQQVLELALIENVQRADLNPLEEARAYQTLSQEFGLSDSEIARRLGKNSREAIANTRRLLQLVSEAQEALLQGKLSAGHGRALLMIKDERLQRVALGAVLERDLSVRATERIAGMLEDNGGDVSAALAALEPKPARPERGERRAPERRTERNSSQRPSPDDLDLQRQLEQALSTPVVVNRLDREVRVTISFHTDEKLQEFFDLLNRA